MRYELILPDELKPGDEFCQFDQAAGFSWHPVSPEMLKTKPIGSSRPFRRAIAEKVKDVQRRKAE